ncbi:cytochrome B561 [Nitratireductor indicus C115]|uniref:Cytochrome B561 n=1 Tax=Nitratireductor indicus C115 TaxID=1231190 RepID=K2N4S2_9HYPH|nr:cytochrome b/b6 domain-containing protein [Nitratireductor indicus]EKF42388.1 cytochrome B561 [Nitratireductor indicus C115]SFQ55520.1 cytochrome b561 [Nitratireductor indicus]
MAARVSPAGYSATQIVLHWLIAALVIFQVIFGEEIVPAYRVLRQGQEPAADALASANIHIYVGIAILVLAVIRLSIRMIRGVPQPPADESVFQRRLAAVVHVILYAVIFGMPITGGMAWFLGIGTMGEIHELAKPVIVIAVALHAAGALWQHFVVRSNVLMRMLKPGPRSAA